MVTPIAQEDEEDYESFPSSSRQLDRLVAPPQCRKSNFPSRSDIMGDILSDGRFDLFGRNLSNQAKINNAYIQNDIWALRNWKKARAVERDLEYFLESADLDTAKWESQSSGINKDSSFKLTFPNGVQAVLKYDTRLESANANVATYKFDRVMGIHQVPVTVKRAFKGKVASLQVWVPDTTSAAASFNEGQGGSSKHKSPTLRYLDWAVQNCDRANRNLLILEEIPGDPKEVAIDNGLAFNKKYCRSKRNSRTPNSRKLVPKCVPLFEARITDAPDRKIAEALRENLSKKDINDLIERVRLSRSNCLGQPMDSY